MVWRLVCTSVMAMVASVAAAGPLAPRGLADRIDAAADIAMAKTGAKGLAIAVIERGRPVLVRGYGVRNAHGDPLTTDTVMYGASLTKAVVAYATMLMVKDRVVSLDGPIAALLPRPLPEYGNLDAYGHWGDLADDDRSRLITPRIVLTHSTGFANFAELEPGGKLRIHFKPGTHYAYSGEGMMLLQFGIDVGLKRPLGPEVQRRVFDRLDMTRTSLMWRADFAGNLADGWGIDGTVEPHDERSRVRAAGSMDTTITDMAKFAAALVRGDGIDASGLAEMVRPEIPITTASQFPTFLPDLPPAGRFRDVAAGLGVMTFRGRQGAGFYKGGHNDTTGNTMVCVLRRDTSQ